MHVSVTPDTFLHGQRLFCKALLASCGGLQELFSQAILRGIYTKSVLFTQDT